MLKLIYLFNFQLENIVTQNDSTHNNQKKIYVLKLFKDFATVVEFYLLFQST